MIDQLNDHFIICGYGRVGQAVASEFRTAGVPCVVLDVDPRAIAIAQERGELWIEGSATSDEILEAAGIERARGLVASADSDADNLFITISARAMRPNLLVVARASDPEAHRKLLRAGADRVTQPFATAGSTMAKLVLRPQVAAFLDSVTTEEGAGSRLEEFEVTPTSRVRRTDDPRAPAAAPDRRPRRLRSAEGRDVRHHAEPRQLVRCGRRDHRRRHRRGAGRAPEPLRPTRDRCRLSRCAGSSSS